MGRNGGGNSKGTVHGSIIRSGTVGSAAITYSGSVSGKSMSGRDQTPPAQLLSAECNIGPRNALE